MHVFNLHIPHRYLVEISTLKHKILVGCGNMKQQERRGNSINPSRSTPFCGLNALTVIFGKEGYILSSPCNVS